MVCHDCLAAGGRQRDAAELLTRLTARAWGLGDADSARSYDELHESTLARARAMESAAETHASGDHREWLRGRSRLRRERARRQASQLVGSGSPS